MGAGLLLPLPPGSYRISSPFGLRRSPTGPNKGQQRHHNGLDMAAPTGTPVTAAAAGKVSVVWRDGVGGGAVNGNAVMIKHGGPPGTASAYLHLSRVDVAVGDSVRAGQRIGAVGSTGRSTGPHLHFMVYEGKTPVDPAPFLPGTTASPTLSAARSGRAGIDWWGWSKAGAVVLLLGLVARRIRSR